MAKLHMETTTVDADKTAGEIQQLLARKGASHISMQYDKGELLGITFIIEIDGKAVPFKLPARVEPVFQIIHKGHGWRAVDRDRAQAKRTAWRILKRWIEAQMAMIETGMVSIGEVFMPYIAIGNGETLWSLVQTNGIKALPMLDDQ